MAIDTSGGPYNGTIYVTWADRRNGSVTSQRLENSDIYFSRHMPEDHDTLWQSPLRVNDDSVNADQWHPWVTVDPDGIVSIVFYDSRLDAANLQSAVFMATSYDGGETFVNYLVSDADFTPCPIAGQRSGFMGDYIGITSRRCWAYPCWNDNRSGVHQVYLARVPTNQIWHDSTWSGEVALSRDLIIAPGATLTIDPGTAIDVSPGCDTCFQGADVGKVELVVEGTLFIDGEPNDPVVFASSGSSSDDWYGIRVIDSGRVIIRNATIKNALRGVSFEAPSMASSVDSCVFESCTEGIRVEAGTPSMTLRNVRVQDCAETGFYLADSVRLVHDTVVGSMTGYGAHLLDCRVDIDSSLIPTRGIACNVLSGDVQWDSTNYLLQDVSIDSTATLTINPGSRVLASSGYALKAHGDVTAIGTEENPIHFGSKLTSPGLQDWAGIWHYGPCNLTMEHSSVSDAYRGLWVLDVTSVDTISINSCEFTHGFFAGVQNDRRNATSPVYITDTRFADITTHGVYVYQGWTEVDGCDFRGSMVYGVRIEDANSSSRATAGVITNCTFDSLTIGSASGVYLSMLNGHSGDPIASANTFGSHWLGGSPYSQTAIYVYNCTDDLTLQNNRIAGDGTSGFKPTYGVLNYSTTTYIEGDYEQSGPSIDDVKNGLYCFSSSSNDPDYAHVRRTKFESGQYGIYVYSNSKVDLQDSGNGNAFMSYCASSGRFSVYNKHANDTVRAKYNYWDSTAGCTTWPYDSGAVDVGSALAADPLGGGGAKRSWFVATDEEPSPTLIPASYVAEGNYPNPFNSSTVIQFSIGQAGHAQLVVFNILGQRVKRLIDEYLQLGIHRATWDGQDESGHPVASGVYFYRLTGDGRQVTKKMGILK